jgi:hypothetical protein
MKLPVALGSSILLIAVSMPVLSLGSRPLHVAKVTYMDVAPLFKANCISCHKGANAPKGLDLTSYAAIMKGSKKGKVVVAGKAGSSALVTVLHGKPMLMPPGGSLPPASIAKIESWVTQGASK